MNNQEIYQSEEFAVAWNNYLEKTPDLLRTNLMNQYIFEKLNITDDSIVLDAGCGNGFFINQILQKKPKQVFACDISPKLIDIATSKFSDKVTFNVADLSQKLEYESNFFDELICYNVLMELDDISLTLSEFSRILIKQGTIHIVVVHPLFQLFVINSEKEKGHNKTLRKYSAPHRIKVDVLAGFDNFFVYSRPISDYMRAFKNAQLQINELDEIFIPESIAEQMKNPDLRDIPVFLYFNLTKKPSR